jgi:signal transduction histidine kinase
MVDFIAHDLANEICAAQLSLLALQQDWAARRPGGTADCLRVVQRSLVQMGYLVADLRDARQMQLGRFVPSADAAVPPRALVAAAVDAAKGYAEGRSFQVGCAARLPPVWVDEQRIQRVFANLIGNAVKFTDADGNIYVGAGLGPTADEVTFFVRDDGEGMTKDEKSRIFEPYWRGQDASRPGTGLGLTISRGIIEAHGGQMFVTSRPDVGSTFTFTLPVARRRLGPRRAVHGSRP